MNPSAVPNTIDRKIIASIASGRASIDFHCHIYYGYEGLTKKLDLDCLGMVIEND